MPVTNTKDLTVKLTTEEIDTLAIALNHLVQAVKMEPKWQAVILKVYDEVRARQPHVEAVTRKQAVKALRSVAADYIEQSRTRKDAMMKKSARDDASDVAYIADLVESNQDDAAKTATAQLDTAVREEMPREAFRFIGLRSIR